tara:strand:+ start:285 stop:1385 length:1101 start_codon:yes stop_codon:yes gene_type:complete
MNKLLINNIKNNSHEVPKKEKEVINVFVNVGALPLAQKTPDGKEYQGILYDSWKLIRQKLEHKYIFNEIFEEKTDYDQMTKDVNNGKYDCVIAPFQLTEDRMKIINFTNNLIIGKHSILHLPKINIYNQLKTIFKNVVIGPLISVLVIGIILALVLYYFEPKRYIKARAKTKNAWRRTMATVIASLFGEAGFLSENSTLSISGLLIVLFIMTFAFFFVMFLQAYVTQQVIKLHVANYYNKENIKGELLLSPKGYAVAKFMERYGAKIEYHAKTIPEIIEIYKKNPKKYAGISLDYLDAVGNQDLKIGLKPSSSEFGYREICWIVNKKKPYLLEDINFAMLPIQFNLETYNICKKYLSTDNSNICNL